MSEYTINDIRIAVDGPSGAGKGELAKRLAARLGLVYLDTGALYRAVGLYTLRKGVKTDDTSAIIGLLGEIKVELMRTSDGTQHVMLNGEDVSGLIRDDRVSTYASAVSKLPEVRAFLDKLQRDAADKGGIIMDGRDIGTVIMPDAKLKIYLTASLEERARRRVLQEKAAGREADYDEILERMKARDKADSTREFVPAVAADDAVILDNTSLDIEGTVEAAVALAKKAYGDIIV